MMWRGPGRGGGVGGRAEVDFAKLEKTCQQLGSNSGRRGEKWALCSLRHWGWVEMAGNFLVS